MGRVGITRARCLLQRRRLGAGGLNVDLLLEITTTFLVTLAAEACVEWLAINVGLNWLLNNAWVL